MMTFTEYMEAMKATMPGPLWLNQATSASLAAPSREDTKRAIERAARRGRAVTPSDLKIATSPESREAARQGIRPVQPPS